MDEVVSDIVNISEGLPVRIDSITAPDFEKKMTAVFEQKEHPKGTTFLLDLARVAYISSAGLRVLLMTQKMAHSKGLELIIKCSRGAVLEVLHMTGFDKVLNVEVYE
ncbi:MAG: STAS domain-containing protein [Candidatus Ancillula sp.]|jgi:anti-sigma B factor antagonist|nr:STAS domain-containing protein [Candidatus Ancillula sp.]